MQLVIRDLSKTYPGGTRALHDVSLTIPRGMFGLLGPNGAGKSTLMRILATLQEPDTGTVHLGDLNVVQHKDAVRETLGYLPQEFGVYPRATAEELRSGIETILREQGLSPAFPAAVEEAAAQAAGSPRLPGRDRTELEFLTIDPVGARVQTVRVDPFSNSPDSSNHRC